MKNKKGVELAISTIILLILGILVLIGLVSILVMGWGNFKMYMGAILGSDTAQAQKLCKIQCSLDNNYDYCCEEKAVKKETYTCKDEILKGDCSMDCTTMDYGFRERRKTKTDKRAKRRYNRYKKGGKWRAEKKDKIG